MFDTNIMSLFKVFLIKGYKQPNTEVLVKTRKLGLSKRGPASSHLFTGDLGLGRDA